jgi:hypothetical protein
MKVSRLRVFGPLYSVVLLLFVSAFSGAAWQQPATPQPPAQEGLPTAAEIDTVMRGLADITGFRIHRQLPFEMVNREQVNQYLKDQIRRSVKPKELRAEEVTLRMFGFVPKDFDLKQTTIDLLTEQAAAFYDFQRHKLFISDWASRNMREVALVHELAHALADQNFPIKRYLGKAGDDAEASLARQSVVEGQASWLMLEYAARQSGRTLKDPATAADYMRDPPEAGPGDTGDSEYPVFSKAPLYIRRTLTFPYEEGQKLQHALFLKEGKASFERLFTQPPSSSSQVIHPDRYLGGFVTSTPELPKKVPGTAALVSGSVGELDHRILLRQYIDQATSESLSPKLKGGAFRIDETRASHRLTLTYVSEWQSEEAASQYFAAYRRVLRGKWKKVVAKTETADQFSGCSEAGFFSVTRAGTKVLSREGSASPL